MVGCASVSIVLFVFVRGSRTRIRLGRRHEVVFGWCTRKPLLGLCEDVADPGSGQRECRTRLFVTRGHVSATSKLYCVEFFS